MEYLSVFVCVSLHDADPILSTGIGHHGDEAEREVAVAGDTAAAGITV